MPKVHDRVLLVLFSLGLVVIFSGGFLNYAPNRLATGVAYPLSQAPALEAAAAMTGLCGLALLSFAQGQKLRSFATILAAALILWGSLAGAGHFAAILMQAGAAGGSRVAWSRVLDFGKRRDPRARRCRAKRKL